VQLAFTTLACPDWTLAQAARAGAEAGYSGIELRLVDGELLRPDLDLAARERVQRTCAEAGLTIVCVDSSVALAQPDRDARAAQVREGLAFVELAANLGVPLLRVFGKPPAGVAMEEALSAATETLAAISARGRELGVTVLLETHDAFASGELVARVLDGVHGAGAGALWDTLHPWRVGEPLATTMQRLGPHLRHVHIKDGRRPLDASPNWELTLLGEGDVPVPSILRALHDAQYNGWLAVEWEKKWHPHLADPSIALPQHAAMLRSYLEGLP
jgi:sugar phosphate isomerase/epimerase